ncbi:uncharacterized protein [Tenebrio molitor]|uniref:uncharacterized protein isoform X1 n=1 Tax=Tenebrio molitor TaxID=7067 RepID=UPI003624A798
MINYRHQDLLNDDVLWVVRILGGKIFQCGVVKFVIKLTLSLYSFLLLAQTYFFVFAPDADQLIQYGPLFFQMCYVNFFKYFFLHQITNTLQATLGMFVVLLRNRMIEDVMEVIDLWDVKSAGEEVESKIKRESKAINIFVVVNTTVMLVWASANVFSVDDDDQVFFTNWLMQKWFFGHTKCLIILIKLTFFVAAPCMTVHGYQIIYTLQHVKFQMYMFNKYVEELTKGFTTCECKLLFDEVYQNEVNFRLKFLIKRHCDFLRWSKNILMKMDHLILPFSMGGCLVGLSIALSFFQITDESHSVRLLRASLFSIFGMTTFWSLITAGQTLQDEVVLVESLPLKIIFLQSERIFSSFLVINWYTWNNKNTKILLIILRNCLAPIKIKFTDSLAINYQLGMGVSDTWRYRLKSNLWLTDLQDSLHGSFSFRHCKID